MQPIWIDNLELRGEAIAICLISTPPANLKTRCQLCGQDLRLGSSTSNAHRYQCENNERGIQWRAKIRRVCIEIYLLQEQIGDELKDTRMVVSSLSNVIN